MQTTYSEAVDAYNASLTHSTPTNLNVARNSLTSTSVGGYGLFGGGKTSTSSGAVSTVDSYDTSLTHGTPTTLSKSRYDLSATSVGNYALFGGGDNAVSNVVDVYTIS